LSTNKCPLTSKEVNLLGLTLSNKHCTISCLIIKTICQTFTGSLVRRNPVVKNRSGFFFFIIFFIDFFVWSQSRTRVDKILGLISATRKDKKRKKRIKKEGHFKPGFMTLTLDFKLLYLRKLALYWYRNI